MKKLFTIMALSSLCLGTNVKAQENIGQTGTVTFTYNGASVVYTTVRAADGNIWLQQNLGSSRVATSRTDADSYGDLFQWGRWDDGHQKRDGVATSNIVLNPNNPSSLNKTGENPFYYNATAANYFWGAGAATDKLVNNVQDVDATTGCDPCAKLLGGDWRLPTQAEFVSLISAESITNYTTAYSSNLKISSAGVRNANNGDLGSTGSLARFWTSTANSSGQAFLANFTNVAATTLNISRGGGISVRCINKPITTPVKLSDFNGSRSNNGIKLNWQTASEKDNSHFEILRSQDGVSFQPITTISGKGNSDVAVSYEYVDYSPVIGTNYYKLKQFDFNGKSEEFPAVVAVEHGLTDQIFNVSYDNGKLKVLYQTANKQGKVNIKLTDISGRILLTRTEDLADNIGEYSYNVSLYKGVYVVSVEDDNQIKSMKVIR